MSSEFVITDEWGVFTDVDPNGRSTLRTEIFEHINKAHQKLATGDLGGCELETMEGRGKLCRAQERRKIWFVANNRFGLLPLIFTLISGLATYFVLFDNRAVKPWLEALKSSPVFLGYVGAILKSLYWLQIQANKGTLRPRWFTYFIVAPAIGSILGGMASFVIRAGFKLLSAADQKVEPDWILIGLVALFAGFKWEWALEKLEAAASAVTSKFGKGDQK